MTKKYKQLEIVPGQKFHSLTVIREDKMKGGIRRILCQCDCGNTSVIRIYDLGRTKTCGCIRKLGRPKHRMSKTPEYAAWKSIKTRCYDPNFVEYQHYGGRGISMCDEWRDDFMAFYDYIGQRPGSGYSVDRVNNDQDYEPGNVKWSTKSQQNRNYRQNFVVTYRGESKPLIVWVEELGLDYKATQQRLRKLGWDTDRAFLYREPTHAQSKLGDQ